MPYFLCSSMPRPSNLPQDWLYEEGEDATKAVYVAKMDEIRFVAGPIVQRYLDKLEEERQARLKIEEEKAAKEKAEREAAQKAAEEKKKAEEAKKAEAAGGEKKDAAEGKEVEMTDAPDPAAGGQTKEGADANGPEIEETD